MNWHEYFSYNAETGKLSWKERPNKHFTTSGGMRTFNTRFAGKEAGTPHSCGYEQIMLTNSKGKRSLYLVHRIVWEMHNGPIPNGLDIDHIDRNRVNNKIENLRLATRSQNLQNSAYRRGVCPLPGVAFDKRRKKKPYYSRLRYSGRVLMLGSFATAEEAHEAWKRACIGLRMEFANVEAPIIDVA
jgi:hypothetical protein